MKKIILVALLFLASDTNADLIDMGKGGGRRFFFSSQVEVWSGGNLLKDQGVVIAIDSAQTVGGMATFQATDSGGNALFSSIISVTATAKNDTDKADEVPQAGERKRSPDLKTIVVGCVAGGAMCPDGTVVNIFVIGIK